jgi:hypothetical protein
MQDAIGGCYRSCAGLVRLGRPVRGERPWEACSERAATKGSLEQERRHRRRGATVFLRPRAEKRVGHPPRRPGTVRTHPRRCQRPVRPEQNEPWRRRSELLSITPDVSELLLKFDYFIIAEIIATMKYCCYYGHQCGAAGRARLVPWRRPGRHRWDLGVFCPASFGPQTSFVYLCAPLCPAAPLLEPPFLLW